MKRFSLLVASLLLALPTAAAAQTTPPASPWTLTFDLGIHADRFNHPERVVNGSDGLGVQYTAPGEAPTVGLRATRWFWPHFGLDAGFALAHNNASQGAGILTYLTKYTLFGSVAPVWRVLPPASRFQLQVGAGPALVSHLGKGQLLLTRATNLAWMAQADASLRISRRMRVLLGAQNYRFTTQYRGDVTSDWGAIFQPGSSAARSEWVIQSGLRIDF